MKSLGQLSPDVIRISSADEAGLGPGDLERFLREVDHDFHPPLSERIDLGVYARKLSAEAINLVAIDGGGQLLGCSSFYCTPEQFDDASLSFIALSKVARGRSIGSALIGATIEHVRRAGMTVLATRTWRENAPMIGLLERFGFEFVEHVEDAIGRTTAKYILTLA